MKLTMLGTGHALVTECYNTCFVFKEGSELFLVDGGGGNTLLRQLQRAGIHWKDIKTLFITHKHIDHVMGIFWLLRLMCHHMHKKEYEGEVTVYAHSELAEMVKNIARMVLQEEEARYIGKQIKFIPVEDGQAYTLIGHKVVFFDTHSSKAKQFGFTMDLKEDEKLTCCGDEPCNAWEKEYAWRSAWLLHEAFCLSSQAALFHPHEKHHSTVEDACRRAEQLEVKNLLLYHTEDRNITRRKQLYGAEGARFFSGNLYIPDDLETLDV